jgi:hypothetical protein
MTKSEKATGLRSLLGLGTVLASFVGVQAQAAGTVVVYCGVNEEWCHVAARRPRKRPACMST